MTDMHQKTQKKKKKTKKFNVLERILRRQNKILPVKEEQT